MSIIIDTLDMYVSTHFISMNKKLLGYIIKLYNAGN